jgi:tRNA threonylcarbamoyl adenosine modification protein YeaZ
MLLAIDTAGPWVSLCAERPGKEPRSARRDTRLDHNETLSLLLSEVLAGLEPPRFSAVAVDVGPGSFTGTRVGVAFALGLAAGWGVPAVPVSTFAMAAELAPADAAEVAVAFPIVRDSWCRAHLERTRTGWREVSVAEVARRDAAAVPSGVPLIVPWGELPGGTAPPAGWIPAQHVLHCAARDSVAARSAERPVRVRYLGPSQAERNYRARLNHDPRRRQG